MKRGNHFSFISFHKEKMEKTDTRQRLLILAKDWFIEHGYKFVKTDDLAKELGISKRTIYSMFPSKDEMLIEALRLPIIDFENKLEELALRMIDDDKFTFFENLISLWDQIIEHSTIFTFKFDAEIKKYLPQFYSACLSHTNKRFSNFKRVFEVGVERGYLKSEINIDVFMNIMHFTMSNMLRNENLANLPLNIKDVLRQIFIVVFTGAMTPAGAVKFYETIPTDAST